ncbi:MAG: universal stress protein [Planctomycetaceae bacterium]
MGEMVCRDGLPRWFTHQIGEPVAHEAHIPTLFVPAGCRGFVSLDDGTINLKRVLFPVDTDIMGPLDDATEVVLLHVGDTSTAPSMRLPNWKSWTWKRRKTQGNAVNQILKASEDADLIAMVTNGPHGFLDALRGSTTQQVVRHAKCPVLAIPTDWRS